MNEIEMIPMKRAFRKYYVTNDEALALLKIWREGNQKEKTCMENTIVVKLAYLVSHKVKYYKDKHYYEDLLQEGRAGLLESIRKFDPTRGINFFKYGDWHIKSKIHRFLKKQRKQNSFEVSNGHIESSNILDSDPAQCFENSEGRKLLIAAINTLPDMDRKVVLMRFGIDGNGCQTFEKIGNRFSLSKQRIEQIASKAIFKLRKNSQIKKFFHEW